MPVSGFHLRVTHKIALIGVIGVAGLLALGGIYLTGEARASRYRTIADQAAAMRLTADEVTAQMLEARRAEKDFQLRNDEKYLARHGEVTRKVHAHLDTLRRQAGLGQVDSLAGGIWSGFETYTARFNALANASRSLGLTPDTGLEGALRKSVHSIEGKLKDFDNPALTAGMLTLRRHEKDYMLRRDDKYVDAFRKSIDAFSASLAVAAVPDDAKQAITLDLASYQRDFLAWANGAQALAGEQKALSAAFASIEPQIEAIQAAVNRIYTEARFSSEEAAAGTLQIAQFAVVILALVVGFLAFVIARAVSKPLLMLASRMKTLSDGDANTAVPFTAGPDEVGDMARAVEVFRQNAIERTRLHAEQTGRQEDERRRQGQLELLVEGFKNDIANVVRMLDQQVVKMKSVASGLTDAAGTAATQARSAAQVSSGAAENSEAVATATEQLTASIKEISAQAHQTSRLVTGTMEVTTTTDRDVMKLGEATERIGSVLDLIRQIAQQTNLLALNATIESARAGDAGKGFAVVASEVKNLATQTARATDEIASQIEGVQLSTQSAIEAIRDISAKVTEINGLTGAIAAAVEEQTAATQEIAHNVSAATDRSRQAAQNVTAVLSAADKTQGEVDHVENVSVQLGAITQDIQRKLEQFVQGLAANQKSTLPSKLAA